MSQTQQYYSHGLRPMFGRERGGHRTASPLELLYDLTYVTSFGVAGNELAHLMAEGHLVAGLGAYLFAMLAIVRAWTSFTWFASAFDTDDWLFRLLTMVQMAGVVVLAIGLPTLFESIDRGDQVINNTVLVMGYVVMRVALVLQWLRAAATDTRFRSGALVNAGFIGLGQVGWVALAVLQLPAVPFLVAGSLLWLLELVGPVAAQRRSAGQHWTIPWHPHHVAERFSLLAIIALGETVFGTLAAAQAITEVQGWSFAAVVTISTGVALGFALWWIYFLVPSAPVLARRRAKAPLWSAGHLPVYVSIAAVGAGLHVIGYQYEAGYEGGHRVSAVLAVSAVALPVCLFTVSLAGLHGWLISTAPANTWSLIAATVLPLVGIALAAAGVAQWVCLLTVLAGPGSVVVVYERNGWRALEAQLHRSLTREPA